MPTPNGTVCLPSRAITRRDLMLMCTAGPTNRTIVSCRATAGINKVYDLTDKLFLFPESVQSAGKDELLRFYAVHYGFARACQFGAIGLAAIEPAKLRDYLPSAYGPAKPPAVKNGAAAIQFAFHQLWILAMLNNQELYDTADRLAGALQQYSGTAKQGKMNLDRQVDKVFVKHRPAFIERLTEILEESRSAASDYAACFDEAVRQVMLMPVDNFPLFIILTRFRYIARQNDGAVLTTSSKEVIAASASKASSATEQAQLNIQ
jgi:hypothetical protein